MKDYYGKQDYRLRISKDIVVFMLHNALSRLHSIKQIHPGSPSRAINTVRFVTLEARVAQLPTKVRKAIFRSDLLVPCLYEYNSVESEPTSKPRNVKTTYDGEDVRKEKSGRR